MIIRWIIPCALALAACAAPVPPVTDDGDPQTEQGAAVSEEQTQSADEPVVAPPAVPAARTVAVTVDNWVFSPAAISAKKGEKIQVRLTGAAGVHGFAAPELGINQRVEPGQTVTVTIPTDKAGTFSFFCSIPCGKGHREMRGAITIQP